MAEMGMRRGMVLTPARSRDRGERELILRAQRFEADALADLFDTHFDAVYRYVNALVGDATASEEIVLRVFVRALDGLPRFHRYESGVTTWLERIANAVLSELAVEIGPAAAVLAVNPAREAQVREAIRNLTPDQLDVLGLRFVAGLPVSQVARATGRGTGRVHALQHRALLAIRRALAGEPERAPAEVQGVQ